MPANKFHKSVDKVDEDGNKSGNILSDDKKINLAAFYLIYSSSFKQTDQDKNIEIIDLYNLLIGLIY